MLVFEELMIPIFEEAEIRRAVSAPDAIAAVRQAFAADGRGATVVPAVINLPIPGVDGEFHVKTAYVAGMPHVAVKVASGFYDDQLGLIRLNSAGVIDESFGTGGTTNSVILRDTTNVLSVYDGGFLLGGASLSASSMKRFDESFID